MLTHARQFVLAALLASPVSFAYQSPLSDESIREAYFLGQRHDGSLERLLEKYSKHLPPPKQGPHIASITFLTPFLQVAKSSDSYISSRSAQQAALDHRGVQETVEISIKILLTDSYGAIIAASAPTRSGERQTYQHRQSDFWKDFQVQVFEGHETREPTHFDGKGDFVCSRHGGNCNLVGATLYLEFPGTAFNSDSATIHIIPPEGPEVWTDFDLNALR